MRHASLWLVLLLLLVTGLARAQTPGPQPTPAPSQAPALAEEPAPSPSPSPMTFELPPLVEPDWGENWWEEPYFFEMASTAKLTGEQRARRVLERVWALAERRADDKNFEPPTVEVDQSPGVTVVRSGPDVLVTVLPEDLPEYQAQLSAEHRKQVERQVAERWAEVLEPALRIRTAVWSAEWRWGNLSLAAGLLVLAILLNRALEWFSRRFLGTPLWSLRAVVWLAWLIMMLNVLPELHHLQWLVFGTMLKPLWLVMTAGLGSALTFQVARAFLRRYLRSLGRHRKDQPRHDQQMASIEGAAGFAMRLVLAVGAFFYVVSGLGLKASHLLAGAGLVGAALTLVSQDLIRDVIAGINILLEDQFVVGDWIQSGALEGEVEAFHLRGTRLRAMDGTATVVPNSELRVVKNHSLGWSQVDYQVKVSLSADARRALELLVEEAHALVAEHPDRVLGEPQVLGVDEVAPGSLTLRLLVKTRPLLQWDFKRELNLRILDRFRAEGIDLAGRRQNVRLEPPCPPA